MEYENLEREQSIKVVIVEDSPTQQEYLRYILEKHGYTVFAATNGQQALDLIGEVRPDLLISDVIMPVMNGYDLCRAIKSDPASQEIPVILLTALSDTKDVALALQSGADNFITKPYNEEYLILRIRQILAPERALRMKDWMQSPVPVSFDGEVYQISSDRGQIFEFLLTAYQVAIMKNQEAIRAEERLKVSYENLAVLNQIISLCNTTLSLDELLELTIQKILNLFGFEFGALYLINEERTCAHLRHHVETIPVEESYLDLIQTLDMGLLPNRGVLLNGIPAFFTIDQTTFYEEREKIIFKELGAKAYAMVPVKFGSEVLGVLALTSKNEHEFSDVEIGMFESVGREVGSAVQKALLQERVTTANDEMSLYLDIMTHDINNVITSSMGYANLLEDELTGPQYEFVQKIRTSLDQTIEIIRNVSTIRRLHEKQARLVPMDLDAVIRNQISRFSEIPFTYPGTGVMVYADDLIGQVFTNLIGNSRKFAGDEVSITIGVEEDEGVVEVTVADNGPGIPDDQKAQIFDRFQKGTTSKSGKGLGLFITWMLVEGYGGTIRADDRKDGRPGTAIHFTLKKFL
ncbi:response regulator [Methanosphaerula palustris]|uniref:Multi-sensor signal transduction histidine kinase n=1 Tax=Methanosphaerula palustris (strain ATCC BAA-1556 / DSM 19958 / E1-9c) TaxID=521011 RepID=B8GHQ9_METPE|nr:response regulator [Methanosphaerula palustris]ACL16664.1 multi-sensor signal transduction histidine kinase [Methanosphaerula palustris E1-9c]